MAQKYVSPVSGTWALKSSSPFGARRGKKNRKHAGNDLQAANGSNAVAVVGGTIQYAGHNGGYQYNAVVMGDDGYAYRYATHGPLSVKVGQRIEQGQPVGKIARSHLHFEVIPPTSPAYAAMKASPGQFVSTQWWGKGTPVTIDPASFLGVKPGAQIAMGAALEQGSRSIVAITPNDPFGVFGFRAGKTVALPRANPLRPGTDLAGKVLDDLTNAIASSASVAPTVASPVPNAIAGSVPATAARTIAASAARQIPDVPAKTIAAQTARIVSADERAPVGDFASVAPAQMSFPGATGRGPTTVAPTIAARTVKRQKEMTVAQRAKATVELKRALEELQAVEARVPARRVTPAVPQPRTPSTEPSPDIVSTAESALQAYDERQQTISTAERALARADTIATAENALRSFDARASNNQGSSEARVGVSSSGRANVNLGNQNGITIAAKGSAGVGASGSAVNRLSRESLIRTGPDTSAPISARVTAGVGTGPGVSDPRPATTTPQLTTARRNLAQTAPQPASALPRRNLAMTAPQAGSVPIALQKGMNSFSIEDSIRGLQTPPAINFRPPVRPPPLKITVPVGTIAAGAPNAAAANAARILATRTATADRSGGIRGDLGPGTKRTPVEGRAYRVDDDGTTTYRTSSGGTITFKRDRRSTVTSSRKVLCGFYKDQGWLPRDIWAADTRWGATRSDTLLVGYHAWAKPVVRRLERQDKTAKVLQVLLWPLVRAWAYEASYRNGYLPKGTVKGKFARFILEPPSYLIGLVITTARTIPWPRQSPIA